MMNRLQIIAGVALAVLLTASAPAAPTQTLHTRMPDIVAHFHLSAVGRLSATQHLRLNIMLPLRDTNGLMQFVKDVQNPSSANFHHFLTPAQFDERFAPTEADYQTVIQFAKTHHFTVTRTVPGRSLIEIDGAVADIEQAFHVALRLYNHPLEGRQFYAPDTEPTLELETSVVAISGLNNFTLPQIRAQGAGPNRVIQAARPPGWRFEGLERRPQRDWFIHHLGRPVHGQRFPAFFRLRYNIDR